MFRLCCAVIFIVPSIVFAIDGTLNISGVIEKNYYLDGSGSGKLYYEIRAKHKVKNVGQHSLGSLLLYPSILKAKKVLSYRKGSFSNSEKKIKINFETAYYYRGKLVMEGCTGLLNGFSFFAKQIDFDKDAGSLIAGRVYLQDGHSFYAKKNYLVPIK